VIAGQGERLIGRTSSNKQVQDFLELVPTYMAKIRTVHETVIRGNLNEVKHVLTRKRFALSRDHFGASPLHLAVLHGHIEVMVYIIAQFPETINGPDNVSFNSYLF
jgi:ankyrin repeat protein